MRIGDVKATGTVRIIDKDGNVKSEFEVESIQFGDGVTGAPPEAETEGAITEEESDAT